MTSTPRPTLSDEAAAERNDNALSEDASSGEAWRSTGRSVWRKRRRRSPGSWSSTRGRIVPERRPSCWAGCFCARETSPPLTCVSAARSVIHRSASGAARAPGSRRQVVVTQTDRSRGGVGSASSLSSAPASPAAAERQGADAGREVAARDRSARGDLRRARGGELPRHLRRRAGDLQPELRHLSRRRKRPRSSAGRLLGQSGEPAGSVLRGVRRNAGRARKSERQLPLPEAHQPCALLRLSDAPHGSLSRSAPCLRHRACRRLDRGGAAGPATDGGADR